MAARHPQVRSAPARVHGAVPRETRPEPGQGDSPKPVLYVALLCNAAIAAAKFVAALVTGSAAMLAEGVHSSVDIGNQVLLLYGIRRSRRPPDAQFPFGYGKEVYFWTFVVAIQLFTVGGGVALARGVLQLLHPRPLEHLLANYVVLAVSLLFEGGSWLFAVKEFGRTKGRRTYLQAVRAGKDPSRFMVLFEDSAALLGLFFAAAGLAAGQLTGRAEFDGVASILVGLVLAVTAAWLAYETKGLLIGESASAEVVADIKRVANGIRGIRAVCEVLSMHVGPQFILVAIALELDTDDPRQRERAIDELDATLKRRHPRIRRVFVRVRHPEEAD